MADDDNHPGLGGAPLVLGGNVFGWTLDRDGSFAVLDHFYELGGRMIDSAEGYSAWVPGNKGGESETIIGVWMEARGVRKDMRIATKVGMMGAPGGLKPENVSAALTSSLERLRSDYVDLYYAHRDDPETPLDEVVSGFAEALASGRARELAASNYSAARLRDAFASAERLGVQTFTALQPKFNLVSRGDFPRDLQQLCQDRGIAVLPYFGLASGFLTGKYCSADDWAGSQRSFALDEFSRPACWDALKVVQDVAARHGTTPASVALAWLAAQPTIAAPIASATSVAQLDELMAFTRLALTPEDMGALDAAAANASAEPTAY